MAKTLSVKELRPKTLEELKRILSEKQEQLRHTRFQVASKEIKNHRELRYFRREIARLQTIIRQKSLEAAVQS